MRTAEQYYDSLRQMSPAAYVLGDKVADFTAHPLIKGQVAAVAQTYALAHDPERRYATCGEFREALEGYRAHHLKNHF